MRFGQLTSLQQNVMIYLFIFRADGPKNIASKTPHTPNAINTALSEDLQDIGLVRSRGAGVYEISGKGCDLTRPVVASELFEHPTD